MMLWFKFKKNFVIHFTVWPMQLSLITSWYVLQSASPCTMSGIEMMSIC